MVGTNQATAGPGDHVKASDRSKRGQASSSGETKKFPMTVTAVHRARAAELARTIGPSARYSLISAQRREYILECGVLAPIYMKNTSLQPLFEAGAGIGEASGDEKTT